MKKRAMTSEKARYVRSKGHQDALKFAKLLGLNKDYQNDIKAKKDVIDQSGYSYSVKSGEKKWQIFLYSLSRFQEDTLFQALNGLGDLFIRCILSFPENRDEYLKNKLKYKNRLAAQMIKIKNYLSEKRKLKGFLSLAFFNGNEVDFLVIKQNEVFNVFESKEVVDIISNHIIVDTSQKRKDTDVPNQKVVFKINKDKPITIGEIEMRNDSDVHYREVKFWMSKKHTFELLTTKITLKKQVNKNLITFGKAIKKFDNRKT